MTTLIIYAVTIVVCGFVFWRNRKNFEDSFKHGETGFSARKLIAFQLMAAVFLGDCVYVYLLYNGNLWAQKIFNEWQNTHLIFVMFVLGFLSFPEIIKFIAVVKGQKLEEKKKDEN